MPKLTDADRKQIETLIEAPDMARDAPPLVRALARIDELEGAAVYAGQALAKAQGERDHAFAESARLAADRTTQANLHIDEITRLRQDVADLRAMLEDAPTHHGFLCGWCDSSPPKHDHDCPYVALLARTAPK